MPKKRHDRDIAAEIEDMMRRDYWFHFSRAQIANRIGCTPVRALRILRNDFRFREHSPEGNQKHRTYSLWN